MGGPHVSLFAEESARLPGIDYVLAGEAENTFAMLIRSLCGDGVSLNSIPGLHWVDADGSYHGGGDGECIDHLDTLPFPDRTKLNLQDYGTLIARSKTASAILSSRGCPYNCTFCDVRRTKVRFRSALNFADEVQQCASQGIHEFYLFDDTFNTNTERVVAICQELIDRKLNVRWSCRGRVDTLTDEVAKLMKEAGCFRIHLGIESVVPRILKLMNKRIDPEQVVKSVKIGKRHGLHMHGFFMIGFPTETMEEINQTLAFARKLPLNYAQFSVTTLFPGTEIYRWAMEQGIVEGDVWREFAKNPNSNFRPPVWSNPYNIDQLYRMMEKAFRAYYLRPRYIWRSLKSLKTSYEVISRFKGMITVLNPQFDRKFRAKKEVRIN